MSCEGRRKGISCVSDHPYLYHRKYRVVFRSYCSIRGLYDSIPEYDTAFGFRQIRQQYVGTDDRYVNDKDADDCAGSDCYRADSQHNVGKAHGYVCMAEQAQYCNTLGCLLSDDDFSSGGYELWRTFGSVFVCSILKFNNIYLEE